MPIVRTDYSEQSNLKSFGYERLLRAGGLAVAQKCWHGNRLHGRSYVADGRLFLVQAAHGVLEMEPVVQNTCAVLLKGAKTQGPKEPVCKERGDGTGGCDVRGKEQ